MSPAASPRAAASGLAWLGGSFAAACVLSLSRTLIVELGFKAASSRGDYESIKALSKTIGVISSSLSVCMAAAAVFGLVLLVRRLLPRAPGLIVAALCLQSVLALLSLLWPVAWLADSHSGPLSKLFDYASIAHGFLYLAFVVTLATGLIKAARSAGLPPPVAMTVVVITASVLETAVNFVLSIDVLHTLDPATRNTFYAIARFTWPVVAALLAALALTTRASFARAPASTGVHGVAIADPDAHSAARGLDTLRTVVWIRIAVGVLGTILLRVMIASDNHEAGKGLAWLLFFVSLLISLVFVSALYSIGRLALARGPATATLALVVLAIPIDGWATLLTTRVLVKPTSFWDSSLHDAMEAARTLPTAMVVSSIVSVAAAILLFVTLASVARSVGDSELEQRATKTIWIAIGAFVSIGIGQVGALQGWISIPVLLLTAVGGLALAITVLARVMGIASSLSARLSS